ncbi:MAG: hypothetical protein JO153_18760 [Solirubrobacterales bacterium]|nr:hypothetical protein [Solirubrobacterales bacterium]
MADRDAAVDAWRHAESVVYPSVMLNADLYQQYIQVIRAISDELRDVHTEDDLVRTWHEQQGLGAEAVDRMAPSMAILMNRDAVRDAAFCKRHREVMREHGKEIAQQRLLEARRTGAEWVVLFEDVTPFGSQRLEMHVRSGRAIHASAEIQPAGPASYELEVVQLDPRDGAWLLDKPPLMPVRRFDRRDEWEARVAQAREQFRKD